MYREHQRKDQKKVVVFDWDDTLVDTGNILVESQYEALQYVMVERKFEYPFASQWPIPSRDDLKSQVGNRFQDVIIPSIFKEQLDRENIEHKKWIDVIFAKFEQFYLKANVRLFKGVEKMLLELYDNGYYLAIATNKSRHLFELEIKKFPNIVDKFDFKICATDEIVQKLSKPNPKMINCVQQFFEDQDLKKEYGYVVVGDRDSDICSAKECDLKSRTRTIAITTNQSKFFTKPDLVLSTAAEINHKVLEDVFKNGYISSLSVDFTN